MTTTRKPRCRMTGEHPDPCPYEALTDLGLCFAHLREAAEEWRRVLADAKALYPNVRLEAIA